ncbi:MAG TPA: Wzz/FepE/Etk N-terminal domain-containing protein [Baekduia sp.]|nr:Wzz/FepE/Etk N-terminal domain-containing protein [Baekduia sp.]
MQGTPTSSTLDHLRTVRQRWRLVLLVTAVTTGVALLVSLLGEKQYDATAVLLLRTGEPATSLVNPRAAAEDPERELQTEVELIEAGETVDEVRRRLRLRTSAEDLLDQVATDTTADSDVVELTVRDPDPRLAARIATTFAEAYVDVRLAQARARYLEAAELAQRQLLALDPIARRESGGRALQARRDELRLTAALQTGGAQVVRRAEIPDDPSRPRPVLSGVLGLVLGLALGLGAAIALGLTDRRLRDEDEVQQAYDLPIIASIPSAARRGQDDPLVREAYGLLAANLRYLTLEGDVRTVMVTSAGPAEGKTSAIIGLSRAFARLGVSVVAVEGDLRRPTFGERLGLDAAFGLTEVLEGERSLDEALRVIDADALLPTLTNGHEGGIFRALPAGRLPANPQRALSGTAIARLLERLSDLADVVLVDSAPVGTVNDAVGLLAQVDAVVLTARLNHTTPDAARRARRGLLDRRVDVAGVVVVDAGPSTRHDYYAPRDRAESVPGGAEGRRV